MRHCKKFNHLGRSCGERNGLLKCLTQSLILHKRVFTTLAKAKSLKKFAEKIITKSKDDSMQSRRTVFSYIGHKTVVKELFDNIAKSISTRNGGYTRIIKMSHRNGDNAAMCMLELVDFNNTYKKIPDSNSTHTGRH